MGRMDAGVSLFSRKVLIQAKAKGLIPDWLRFVKGLFYCLCLCLLFVGYDVSSLVQTF